jgi:hypothetical protein
MTTTTTIALCSAPRQSGPRRYRERDAHLVRAVAMLLAWVALGGCSAESDSSPLFGPDARGIPRAEQDAILTRMGFTVERSDAGVRFVDPDCGAISALAEVVDLDRDATPEVFVHWGNTCTSGYTGQSLILFVKDDAGTYEPHLGVPAFGYRRHDRPDARFPDLELGGPGICAPLWRWTGTTYDYACNLPRGPGGCDQHGDVCALP